MANKFPLILNTSANQIQELASGDNLDLTGSGIHNAGVITATSFSGNITGGVTGNADTATLATNVTVTANNSTNETVYPLFVDGATGTQGAESDTGLTYNPSSGNLTSTQFTGTLQTAAQPNITSVGTLSALNVSGNVSVGGTLTYEDVTNIDSVGIITARDGLKVLAGGANVVGVVTASAGITVSAGTATFQGAIDANSDLDVDGHTELDNVNIAGVTTAAGNIIANGSIDLAGDIDVDGHTNLDNVSIAGVSTFASNITRQGSGYASINIGSTNAGGATLVLDGDSNGDFLGNDYSSIQHTSDGNLIIKANSPAAANCYIALGSAGHYGAMFKEGAESLLRYNNSTKIETTNTGAVVTGILTATGNVNTGPVLTVTGTEGVSANLYLIADDGDDNGDGWRINSNQDVNDLTISNNATGSYVDKVTVTGDKVMLSVDLKPDTNNQRDFGTNSNRFKDAYFSGTVTAGNFVGGLPITNGSDNRIITASSASALNAESALTFDGNLFYLSSTTGRIEIRASNGSTEVTTARFHNAATADNRVLISCEANQGGDPYVKFDSGGTNFVVGQRWAGTTNNLLVMGAGENAQSISGLFIKNNGYLGINKNNPGQALDIAGHVEINGTTDGVINLNTTSGNGAFARFRKGNSTDTAMYVGASKGFINGSNNVNDGGVNAQQGIMYLNSASGVFKFTTGAATSSGIDIIPRGSNNSSDSNNATSPFIRFYDYPSGNYADTTTADDNNWAIGADDSGESKFKIICGGGSNSNLVTNISDSGQTGTTAIAFTSVGTGCKTEIRRIQTSEISDLSGTGSVGSTTVNAHYNASPAVGTYMVHGFIEYRDSAPANDPDQCRMRLQVGGSSITEIGILDEDSNNINRNDNNSFTAVIDVDGSTNVQVNVHTTDPSDSGGADYRYSIQIYKIG